MTTRPVPLDGLEFDSQSGPRLPRPRAIRDDVWIVPTPLQSSSMPYTLSYVIIDGDGGAHLVDPGDDSDEAWHVLCEALRGAGLSMNRVVSVVVTHLHHDHLGMVRRIRERSDARIVLHRVEQEALNRDYGRVPQNLFAEWGVPEAHRLDLDAVAAQRSSRSHLHADDLVDDGDRLDLPGLDVRAVLTPGHTRGHMCLDDRSHDLAFTGDHVIPTIYPGLGIGGTSPSNPLSDYLASLEIVSALDTHEACPGHGYRFVGIADRARATAEHHRRRTAHVADALDAMESPSLWEVAQALPWSAGWQNLRGYGLDSALRMTSMHVDFLGRTAQLRGA